MADLKLLCAVYGEGSRFYATVARDAKVVDLQEVIAGVLSTEQDKIPLGLWRCTWRGVRMASG